MESRHRRSHLQTSLMVTPILMTAIHLGLRGLKNDQIWNKTLKTQLWCYVALMCLWFHSPILHNIKYTVVLGGAALTVTLELRYTATQEVVLSLKAGDILSEPCCWTCLGHPAALPLQGCTGTRPDAKRKTLTRQNSRVLLRWWVQHHRFKFLLKGSGFLLKKTLKISLTRIV